MHFQTSAHLTQPAASVTSMLPVISLHLTCVPVTRPAATGVNAIQIHRWWTDLHTLLNNFRSKTPKVVVQQLHPLLVIRFTSLKWWLQTPTCHHYWITKPPLWRFESLPESNHQIWMQLLYHHIWSFKKPHLNEQNSFNCLIYTCVNGVCVKDNTTIQAK